MRPRANTVLPPLLTLPAATLLAATVEAQQIPSPYRFIDTRQEAGVFVGRMEAGTGRFDLGPAGGTALGVRYGIELTGPIGLEGTVWHVPTTRPVIDPRRPPADRSIGDADVSLLGIEARLRFSLTGQRTWHSLSPFLSAGGGVSFDLAGRPPLDEELREQDRFRLGTSFTASLGSGVKWFLTERVVVRGDAGLALWQLQTPGGVPRGGVGARGAAPERMGEQRAVHRRPRIPLLRRASRGIHGRDA